MNDKEVLQASILPVKDNGLQIRIQATTKWLVVDCYEDKKYRGRYLINRDGKHGFLEGKHLVRRKLESRFIEQWTAIRSIPDDDLIVQKFFGNKWRYPAASMIRDEECDFDRELRWKAEERKQKRIDDLMMEVDTLPDSFEKWVFQTVFPENYMFPAESGYYCSACCKVHDMGKLKHNMSVICPDTQKPVIVKKRQKMIIKRQHCMVLQEMGEEKGIARHFVLEITYTNKNVYLDAFEELRIIFEKTGNRNVKLYYGQYKREDEFGQEWSDKNPWGRHTATGYCFPEGVTEALRGSQYEKLPIAQMANAGWRLQYNKLMINYYMAPVFEYLMKMNLRRLAQEEAEYMGFGYYGHLKKGERADEVLGISMQRVRRMQKLNGGVLCLIWLRWEEEHKKKLSDEDLMHLMRYRVNPQDLAFIQDRMSPVQVLNYMERQMSTNKRTFGGLMSIWKDYLSMAKRLNMDMQDEIVYRPKDLVKRHDDLVELINEQREDLAAKAMQEKYPKVDMICQRITSLYSWQGESYSILVPKGIADIMQDSRQLHHCAGASERYYERIQSEETFIVFLRRNERLKKAWYTLEIEPGGTVRQKRSEYNRQPELDKVQEVIKEWQKVVRERLQEEDKKKAEESRRKRIEEMKKLETSETERDRDLFRLLSADLSEAV